MRWVTRKPPNILTEASIKARKPKIMAMVEPDAIAPADTASSAPTTMTEEMALVTDMSRSEEHTSELQSLRHLVCRLLLEKKNKGQHNRLGLRRVAQVLTNE